MPYVGGAGQGAQATMPYTHMAKKGRMFQKPCPCRWKRGRVPETISHVGRKRKSLSDHALYSEEEREFQPARLILPGKRRVFQQGSLIRSRKTRETASSPCVAEKMPSFRVMHVPSNQTRDPGHHMPRVPRNARAICNVHNFCTETAQGGLLM